MKKIFILTCLLIFSLNIKADETFESKLYQENINSLNSRLGICQLKNYSHKRSDSIKSKYRFSMELEYFSLRISKEKDGKIPTMAGNICINGNYEFYKRINMWFTIGNDFYYFRNKVTPDFLYDNNVYAGLGLKYRMRLGNRLNGYFGVQELRFFGTSKSNNYPWRGRTDYEITKFVFDLQKQLSNKISVAIIANIQVPHNISWMPQLYFVPSFKINRSI